MGHKISKEQIDPGVKDHIMSFVGDINELETDEKSNIISAVNSLMVDRVDNAENMGKLANAIGEPVTANHSVDEVVEGLGEMLSTFKTNMMNSGVMVESSDKFKQLIDKIKGLTEGEGNKGIQFASGKYNGNYETRLSSITIPINANFVPTYVFCEVNIYKYDSYTQESISGIMSNLCSITARANDSLGITMTDISADSFTLNWSNPSPGSYNYTALLVGNWYAIGVGEEDTTLRDSLASILQEEGVGVTEEDDMASLISKVDSEFENKENEIENIKNRLYELMSEGGYDINNGMNIDDMLGLLELSGISVTDIKQIACGGYYAAEDGYDAFTYIVKSDGSLWSCGFNNYGQLGLGTSDTQTSSHTSFVQVTTNINNDVKYVNCGAEQAFIIKNDGSLWACGNNNVGQLGLNDTAKRTTFTKVTTNINNDVKQVVCGELHTFIIKNDGSLWGCGRNDYGVLGTGDSGNTYSTFTQVTTNINNDVKQVACGSLHTIILKNDGTVWSCGYNYSGQLGLNDTAKRTTFTKVTTNINNDVKQIACGGYHTFILKNDGSVWSCGENGDGQLGLNSTTDKTSFTQVTTNINNDVKEVICGYHFTYMIKNDDTVWACGMNSYGQLGLTSSNTTDKLIFTQVTTNTGDVKQISCGGDHVFILKNDGSVWSCGCNYSGELGIGNNTNQYSFVNVPRGL